MERSKKDFVKKKHKKSVAATNSLIVDVPGSSADYMFSEETAGEADVSIECQILDAAQDVLTHPSRAQEPVMDNIYQTFETELLDFSQTHSINQLSEFNGNNHTKETPLINISNQITHNVEINEVMENLPTAPMLNFTTGISNNARPSVFELDLNQRPYMAADLSIERVLQMPENHIPQYLSEKVLLNLYENKELEQMHEYICQFISTQLEPKNNHPLFVEVSKYMSLRKKLLRNCAVAKAHQSESNNCRQAVWSLLTKTVSESGECQDGNPVEATVDSTRALFNSDKLEALKLSLNSYKDSVQELLTTHWHLSEAIKEQITAYIFDICHGCLLTKEDHVSPKLLTDAEQSSVKENVTELRLCVSILFHFQRKDINNLIFMDEIKKWLCSIILALTKIGVWQDHLLLLNHILRSPPGMAQEMVSFIQMPLPDGNQRLIDPFQNRYIAHIIAMMATIMSPIVARDKFLAQYQSSKQSGLAANVQADGSWVLVDSEGEDEFEGNGNHILIKESDLVALLNQIPWEYLFSSILHVEKYHDGNWMNINDVDHHYMMQIFSFSTLMVRLFERGLHTYRTTRYKQFAKRLGQLIVHTVKYVTEFWECYSATHNLVNTTQLQDEYSVFFLRATHAIYSSHKLGTWQYLYSLPYGMISLNTLWELFYMLHIEYNIELENPLPTNKQEWDAMTESTQLMDQFEERLSALPDTEALFLLSAFSTMIADRESGDSVFLKVAVLDLFQVGFLSNTTQDRCYKFVRSLLVTITTKHPFLISHILKSLSKYTFMEEESTFVALFQELPLCLWLPLDDDLAILRYWLLKKPLMSTESLLARLIISRLNYNRTSTGMFLSYNFHCKIAIMVVEAVIEFAPEGNMTNTGALSSAMANLLRPGSGSAVVSSWGWSIITRLRIHLLDQVDEVLQEALYRPSTGLKSVPDLYEDAGLKVVANGVLKGQPIACYAAILLTLWGHSVPLIASKGFSQLTVLLQFNKSDAVISALHYMIPFFLCCPESLANNETLPSILVALCSGDRTYMKCLSANYVSPALKQVGHVIESHIFGYRRYGLDSPNQFVHLWMHCLSHVPNWMNENAVLYLMDVTIRSAFFHGEAKSTVLKIVKELYLPSLLPVENVEPLASNPAAKSSFFTWVLPGQSLHRPSLMSKTSLPMVPWFAVFAITVEDEWQESCGLWSTVLSILFETPGKPNVDAALKKSFEELKLGKPIPTNQLCIYRWALQALDTPVDNALLPYMWQRFFIRYLARVPAASQSSKGSVGHKFFSGLTNAQILVNIKSRLCESVEYYNKHIVLPTEQEGAVEPVSSNDANEQLMLSRKQTYYSNCVRLFQTYLLWLEDPRLMEPHLIVYNLPPMFDIMGLTLVLSGEKEIWPQYICPDDVQSNIYKGVVEWEKSRGRFLDLNEPAKYTQALSSTKESTFTRLKSYDLPVQQTVEIIDPGAPKVPTEIVMYKSLLLAFLDEKLRSLMDYAQTYALRMAEHTALDCSLLELLPSLYKNYEMGRVVLAVCNSSPPQSSRILFRPSHVTCAGPAYIRLQVCEVKVIEAVERALTQNREDYDALLTTVLAGPPKASIHAALMVEMIARTLVGLKLASDERNHPKSKVTLCELGLSMIYRLVATYNDELDFYPPSRMVIHTTLQLLGPAFLQDNGQEVERLVSVLLEDSRLLNIISPFFSPNSATTTKFLSTYALLTNTAKTDRKQPYGDVAVVLLSKFDVRRWLHVRRPSLTERSTFISSVMDALFEMGLTPSSEKLTLHRLYCNHLTTMLLFEFPEHFGEILDHILCGSGRQTISLDVWYDFLNALLGELKIYPGIPLPQLKDEIKMFATEQTLLSYNVLLATSELLGNYFYKERLAFGLYGLYPKYRMYVDLIITFQAMLGHSLTVATLQEDHGALSDKIGSKVWTALKNMYSPWISPLWTTRLEEPTAAWIQHLTDDRSVLLPWISSDSPHANRAVMMFVEGIRFILDTLPAWTNILSELWSFYVDSYANPAVKEYLLDVVHPLMGSLPWQQFWPTTRDLELMLRVINQFVPSCHAFLGSIFIEVRWSTWVSSSVGQPMCAGIVAERSQICLLNLYVKLSNESSVRQKTNKVTQMLTAAEKFAWHMVDANAYSLVVDWWVSSCDPKVVGELGEPHTNPIDSHVMSLLRIAGAFTPESKLLHPTTLYKRILFVRGIVKMLINCVTRHKAIMTKFKNEFSKVVYNLLSSIESLMISSVIAANQLFECSLLIKEVLVPTNLPTDNELGKLVIRMSTLWLEARDSTSIVLCAYIKVLGTDVPNPITLGILMETCLCAFFKETVTQIGIPSWSDVLQMVAEFKIPRFEDSLLPLGQFLTLYVLLCQRLKSTRSIEEEGALLSSVIDCLNAIKPMEEHEAKLPLLWGIALDLIEHQLMYNRDRDHATRNMQRLISHFTLLSDDKGQPWGILGSLGFRKPSLLSTKCRLLGRSMALFLVAQLPLGEGFGQVVHEDACSSYPSTSSNERTTAVSSAVPIGDFSKGLRELETLTFNKNYSDLKPVIAIALQLIIDPSKSIHNSKEILGRLTRELYNQQYLSALCQMQN